MNESMFGSAAYLYAAPFPEQHTFPEVQHPWIIPSNVDVRLVGEVWAAKTKAECLYAAVQAGATKEVLDAIRAVKI